MNEIDGSGVVSFCVPLISGSGYVNINANLHRDKIFELGRKGPYFRYWNYPVQIRDGSVEQLDNSTIKTIDEFPTLDELKNEDSI